MTFYSSRHNWKWDSLIYGPRIVRDFKRVNERYALVRFRVGRNLPEGRISLDLREQTGKINKKSMDIYSIQLVSSFGLKLVWILELTFHFASKRRSIGWISGLIIAALLSALSKFEVTPSLWTSSSLHTMFVFDLPEKKRPNRVENKERWNASWERDLRSAYKHLPKDLPLIGLYSVDYSDQIQYMTPEVQQQLIEIHDAQHAPESEDEVYLDLQATIRLSLLRSLATEALAEKCTTLTLQSRREYIGGYLQD